MVLTDSATSAPIPSPAWELTEVLNASYSKAEPYQNEPGIRVTVYFPPNFVGLNISDWTVAMAISPINKMI